MNLNYIYIYMQRKYLRLITGGLFLLIFITLSFILEKGYLNNFDIIIITNLQKIGP